MFKLFFSIFRALAAYRGFVLGSVKREFQSKYQNSLLGALWVVANPLAMITIYTVIFSEVLKAKLPGVSGEFSYGIYICAGVLAWGFFAEVVLRAQNIFLDNANLIKKLSFPKICLPAIVLLSASLNFAIIFGIFILFLIFSGSFPGFVFFYLLPVLALQIVFSIGLGVTLGVLNVFFRDVGQFFGIFIQFWFWLTPIVYPREIIPQSARFLLELNPMAPIIGAYQDILVLAKAPELLSLIYPAVIAFLFLASALYLFRSKSHEMADEI